MNLSYKLLCLLVGLLPAVLCAQPARTTLLAPHLHSLRLTVNGNAEQFPVIRLDGTDQLEVSFDDLTHAYRRYTYSITHCDWQGNPTDELFESDYVDAVAESEVIDDYQPSINTSVQYLHYRFTLPNGHMRPLLSGNYLLTVFADNDEGEPEPVVKTYFGVVDTQVGIEATCTTNTEVDWNESHQQLSLKLNMAGLVLRDAESEVKTIVMQNRRYDTAVCGAAPTAQSGNTLLWEHDRRLLFKAGNEYRKMEMLSTRYPGMHGESMRWFEPYFHYTLQPDAPRRNYLYDEDRDGCWFVRASGAAEADHEADYVLTHFTLDMLPQTGRKVYIDGNWTHPDLRERYLMHYNHDTQCYEAALLLKLGYYNYQYLCVDSDCPDRLQTAPIEGDFYQTENEYNVLVYYRSTAGRYWQLVGCRTLRTARV